MVTKEQEKMWEEEAKICPKCGKKTIKFVDEECEMGHFSGQYCSNPECHFDEIEASKPRWMVEEERDSLVSSGKARYLPSGDFELADEYGGY